MDFRKIADPDKIQPQEDKRESRGDANSQINAYACAMLNNRILYGLYWAQPSDANTYNEGPSVPPSYIAAREAVKSHILEVNHDTAWDDVIGNESARAALRDAIEAPKLNAELYAYYGMKPPKGVMLSGLPIQEMLEPKGRMQ